MLISFIILIYALVKFLELIERKNPVVSTYEESSPTDLSNPINLNEMGFRAAWAFRGYSDKEIKNDPAYVKQVVRYIEIKNFVRTERIMPFHLCTEDDYA